MLLLVRIFAIICVQSFHFTEEKSEVQGDVSLGVEYVSLDSAHHRVFLFMGTWHSKSWGTEEKRAGILEKALVWESGNFCSNTISVITYLHDFRKSISFFKHQ